MPEHFSEMFHNLLDQLLKWDAHDRITIDEVIQHEVMRSSVEKLLKTEEYKNEYILLEIENFLPEFDENKKEIKKTDEEFDREYREYMACLLG